MAACLRFARRWTQSAAARAAHFSTARAPQRALRVVFFGTDEISLRTLRALHRELAPPTTTFTTLTPSAPPAAPLLSRLELVCTPDQLKRSKRSPCATKAFAATHQLVAHQVPRAVDFRMRGWHAPFLPPPPQTQPADADAAGSVQQSVHAPASSSSDVNDASESPSSVTAGLDYSEPFDVGVVASFGYFIPPRVIAAFRLGMLNMHPSLLPAYRGSAPIPHALLNGDRVTGVSVITVDPTRLDGGHILLQTQHPIAPNATFASLSEELAALGAESVIGVLRAIAAPPAERTAAAAAMLAQMHESREAAIAMCAAVAVSQPGSAVKPAAALPAAAAATLPSSVSPVASSPPPPPPRAPKLSADDERIDLHTCSAAHVYRRWQALHGTRFAVAVAFRGARVNVLEAVRVRPRPGDEDARMRPGEFYFDKAAQLLRVRCADVPPASRDRDSDSEWSSTVIGFARVVPALKRPMSAADFCNGYKLLDARPRANATASAATADAGRHTPPLPCFELLPARAAASTSETHATQ